MLRPIVIPSPNKKYKAVLKYMGEIQPGNSYFSLSIDGFAPLFENRVFGHVCLWSPESRFLAVQEWKESNDASIPKSYLLLIIDLTARRECVVASMDRTKGKILPQGFIGESLMYTVIYEGQFGTTKNFESKFHYLDGWQGLK
jgi:hypothetical protein